jgi:hypothetical protein
MGAVAAGFSAALALVAGFCCAQTAPETLRKEIKIVFFHELPQKNPHQASEYENNSHL